MPPLETDMYFVRYMLGDKATWSIFQMGSRDALAYAQHLRSQGWEKVNIYGEAYEVKYDFNKVMVIDIENGDIEYLPNNMAKAAKGLSEYERKRKENARTI